MGTETSPKEDNPCHVTVQRHPGPLRLLLLQCSCSLLMLVCLSYGGGQSAGQVPWASLNAAARPQLNPCSLPNSEKCMSIASSIQPLEWTVLAGLELEALIPNSHAHLMIFHWHQSTIARCDPLSRDAGLNHIMPVAAWIESQMLHSADGLWCTGSSLLPFINLIEAV